MKNHYIKPNWPAPQNIHAFVTTKAAGNLLDINCRKQLPQKLNLPNEPIWLKQMHENKVICADKIKHQPEADASYATLPNRICAVLTADCLPILLCDHRGTKVAAIHTGWRSLASGIIENTINKINTSGAELMAWLGPAIGPENFVVGMEVYEKFLHYNDATTAFKKVSNNIWSTDIYLLAKQRLLTCGVTNIYGGDFCTYSDSERFFSYRRDGETGRMASLIWFG